MTKPAPGVRHRAATAAALLVVAALLGAQVLVQRRFESRWPLQRYEKLIYLPAGSHLRILAAGYETLAADALWFQAIGYVGAHAVTDQSFPWLHHIIDLVTTLDPAFRMPYFMGGIVLAVEHANAGQSIAILRKGMQAYPGDWRWPFYIGFDYFYYAQDASRAADYMRLAATIPGRPPYLPRLAASLMAESGRLESAIAFLGAAAEEATEEYVRQDLLRKIEDLRAGRVPEGLRGYLAGRK